MESLKTRQPVNKILSWNKPEFDRQDKPYSNAYPANFQQVSFSKLPLIAISACSVVSFVRSVLKNAALWQSISIICENMAIWPELNCFLTTQNSTFHTEVHPSKIRLGPVLWCHLQACCTVQWQSKSRLLLICIAGIRSASYKREAAHSPLHNLSSCSIGNIILSLRIESIFCQCWDLWWALIAVALIFQASFGARWNWACVGENIT